MRARVDQQTLDFHSSPSFSLTGFFTFRPNPIWSKDASIPNQTTSQRATSTTRVQPNLARTNEMKRNFIKDRNKIWNHSIGVDIVLWRSPTIQPRKKIDIIMMLGEVTHQQSSKLQHISRMGAAQKYWPRNGWFLNDHFCGPVGAKLSIASSKIHSLEHFECEN